ncbi:aminotransferase class I/II-fold pyridoxal phosphate-dependent enzyme, partial [Corallococcus exiguus]|uniref:aminotransferase class I/II-fold pyridoxal phosphate-dependent enzyme n=1 Tax=Corallococcus exiguus TaxID=83462 RepID=UPI0014946581
RDGLHAVLIGPPNAGKSSLLNALAGSERAIVTDIAGTTRDTLRETIRLDGLELTLVDTAGLRDGGDAIEREGMRRAHVEIERTDLALIVLDARDPAAGEAALGEAVAVAALTDDVPWMEACAAEAVENRERLRGALKALGLEPLPSEGNFLLVPVPEARWVGEALRERNVNVRVFEGLTGVGDALRIGCGPWPMMASALKALKEVL